MHSCLDGTLSRMAAKSANHYPMPYPNFSGQPVRNEEEHLCGIPGQVIAKNFILCNLWLQLKYENETQIDGEILFHMGRTYGSKETNRET